MENRQNVLLGIVVDLSSSMQLNWNKKISKRKVDLIRESLNNHFAKLKTIATTKNVDLFVLGIGLRLPMNFINYSVTNGVEKRVKGGSSEVLGIISDLIALSEIVPSEKKLTEIKGSIKKDWVKKSNEVLSDVKFDEDLPAKLKDNISKELHKSVRRKWDNKWFFTSSIIGKFINSLFKITMSEVVIDKEVKKIQKVFIDDVIKSANSVFDKKRDAYHRFINRKLEYFVRTEIYHILKRSSLGYSTDFVLENFNKDKFLDLSDEKFNHVQNDFSKKFRGTWAKHRVNLIFNKYRILAPIDLKSLKKSTEETIKFIGWGKMKPFVESTIEAIFNEQFEELLSNMSHSWIKQSTHREAFRSVSELENIFPDSSIENVYSEKYMFGTTPMYEAINRCSIRFLNSDYNNHDKYLLIISDGEYDFSNRVNETGRLLQKTGVKIISGVVRKEKVLNRLTDKMKSKWSDGMKNLFNLSSMSNQSDVFMKKISKSKVSLLGDNKFAIQVNHPKVLNKIIDLIVN